MRILAGGHARGLDLTMLVDKRISAYGNLLSQALQIYVPFLCEYYTLVKVFLEMQ